MKFLRLIPLALVAFSGCAIPRLASEFPPTDQHLSAPVPAGHARVIVFNSSNALLYGVDHSARMNVLIDGRALAALDRGEYAQVFLPPGRHDFQLRRRDVFWIETEHPLRIDDYPRYLKISSQPGENQFEPLDQVPADFAKKYRPVENR